MTSLFFAVVEATPPGDDLMGAALIVLGIAMVVAFVATLMVTPKAEPHH